MRSKSRTTTQKLLYMLCLGTTLLFTNGCFGLSGGGGFGGGGGGSCGGGG